MPTILSSGNHPQVRSALQFVVEQKPGWEICAVATDVLTLLAATGRFCPDLIILDTELSGLTNWASAPGSHRVDELVHLVHRLCQVSQLVALSSNPNAQAVARSAGMQACVSKSDPPEILIQVLQAVLDAMSLNSTFRRES